MGDTQMPSGRVGRSIVLIVLLLLIGGLVSGVLISVREHPPRSDLAALAPLVESTTVRCEDVVEAYVGYGSARALRQTSLAAEIAATVIERPDDVRDGAGVSANQVLLHLDDREFQIALARASALAAAERASLDELNVEAIALDKLVQTATRELRVAADERARLAGLFERELAAKKEFDFANLAYQQAQRVLQEYELQAAKMDPRRLRLGASIRRYEQEAALARLNVERCTIRAPFAGRLESVAVDVGDRVSIGAVVATLVDPTQVEIPIQLPAGVYHRVHVGTACRLSSQSAPELSWHGTVARVNPTADATSRTFSIYVVVDGSDESRPLVPGMFVTARVEGPVHPGGLLVPRRAYREGRIYLYEAGLAKVHTVTLECFLEDDALVSGDVRGGDIAILSRLDRLVDGTPVRIRPTPSVEAEPAAKAVAGSPETMP